MEFILDLHHHYYCPICGEIQFPTNTICVHCHNQVKLVKSKFEYEHYREESLKKYGDYTHWKEFLMPEIEQNPLYNPKNIVCKPDTNISYNQYQNVTNKNIPKCPTCGSTNIQKISVTSKVVGASLFGLFSKNATSQFKCNNCGYKW